MQASIHDNGILVFLSASYHKVMLFNIRVKDTAGTVDHVQNALAS